MMRGMIDMALQFDPQMQRFDLVFDGVDIAMDATVQTPLLIALGSDRRAHVDDVLPDVSADALAPKSLNERRGWAGDAIGRAGNLIGSRLWLLRNAKQTEETRRAAESMAAEALAPLQAVWGQMAISVRWWRAGVLGINVQVGPINMTFTQGIGA